MGYCYFIIQTVSDAMFDKPHFTRSLGFRYVSSSIQGESIEFVLVRWRLGPAVT